MVLKSSITGRQWCTPGDNKACPSRGLVAYVQLAAFVMMSREQPGRVTLLIF